ncbi:hypothetical protein LOZ55_004658 [Ophidiomyces ophidiicola]|nr:hypothetical protein LOZ55_004658 [Ophidiomyces ophidiicola]
MATPSISSAHGTDKRASSVAAGTKTSSRQSRNHGSASPHTPQQSRHMHSPFTGPSSPGSSFRHEEDSVIIEIGSRYLRAGFEGNSVPMCIVGFNPEEGRRVGDYRGWIKSTDQDAQIGKIPPTPLGQWSTKYELWTKDIRDFDISFFEAKLERSIRELYNKYLLTDAGSSRLILVLPSIVPHPLLSSLLSTIFHRWRYPSITLLPSPAMAAVAAGVRSALVVDIGWEETTITAIYEYREIQSKRSVRAMRLLMQHLGRYLTGIAGRKGDSTGGADDLVELNFELCEEILTRFAWCRPRRKSQQIFPEQQSETSGQVAPDNSVLDSMSESKAAETVSLPLPVEDTLAYIDVPFSCFPELVEQSLFGNGVGDREFDDEDTPLDKLVYNTLLSLSSDARGACISRVTFAGGGSLIPGIRQRILEDVKAIIDQRQWSPAGTHTLKKRPGKLQLSSIDQQLKTPSFEPSTHQQSTRASERAPDTSFIDERLQHNDRDSHPQMNGALRQVDSLGSWAGASLVASLRVRGFVEVDREKFLQHGLSGANRDHNISTIMDRRSGYGPSMSKSGGDRSSWTLGEWA